MSRKRLALAVPLLAVLLGVAAGDPHAAVAKEIRYNSFVPPSLPNNKDGVVPFFERVKKDTNGEVTARFFLGGQLFSAAATLSGIRDGVIDAGFTTPVFTPADLKSMLVIMDLQPYTRDPLSAAAAAAETLLLNCPECLDEFEKNNAIPLGGHATTLYYMMCNTPVKSVDDFRGLKIRGAVGFMGRWFSEIGATAVNLTPADILQALQRKQIDCTVAPKDWLTAFSLVDALQNIITDVAHGVNHGLSLVTMNLKTWKSLKPEHRAVLLKHTPQLIADTVFGYMAADETAMKRAAEKKVQTVEIGAAYAGAWEKFKVGELDSILAAAKSRGVADPKRIVDVHLANLRKWEAKVDEIGGDREKFVRLLWDEVYSKVSAD